MKTNVRGMIVPLALLALALLPSPSRAAGDIAVSVDASDAGRRILHVQMKVPAKPGPLSLSYPRWIPGEHGPTGPLTDVAGLRISANGQPLQWKRDGVDMYRVTCTAPAGTQSVDVAFDFLLSTDTGGFSSAASATENLLLLSWNMVTMYPSGKSSEALTYRATLTLPAGWKYGTSLPVEHESGSTIVFAPASYTTLVDSPVLAGRHFRSVDLSHEGTPKQSLDMACDSEAGLEIPDAEAAHLRQLMDESFALFGARHYRQYHFLLTLSDHTAHFGLEHHESSDDRVHERTWLEDHLRLSHSNLLSHELVHSWNGKYRRPAGLATGDFHTPMQGEMLWVYEGLTQYLGFVLASRSGIRTTDQGLETLARVAAELESHKGRTWRPLVDTAVEAQLLYEARDEWEAWRRSVDFYDEGLLLWLEADVKIRELTGGRKSLDDFCHAFHGGESGAPKVVPYTFDDVVKTLNGVAPWDWKAFLEQRLWSLDPHPPTGGIENGGWALAWTDSLPSMMKANEQTNESVGEEYSIGVALDKDGKIADVIPDSPASRAGVGPGMKLVAVNGRHWSKDVLRDAIRATASGAPLDLLVDNGEFFRDCKLDWTGGLRYPRLVRADGKADVVTQILTARVGR